ncbi:MAG: ParB/RepB/Spo0J family partition protein [Anaerolineae bacterium]
MPTRTVNLEVDDAPEIGRRSRRGVVNLSDPNVKVGQVNELEARLIKPGDNDRTVFKREDLESLASSIKDVGLAQPILVRPINHPTFQYEIVAGERRFRACQLIGWDKIPAIVRPLKDEQASAIMLAENVHRVDIDPIDEANAYRKRMDKFKWSIPKVSKEAKVSEKRVAARLSLLNLLEEVQKMIQSEKIGVQFGEVMAPLDQNRQRIALKYLTTVERPLLREFKALCGKLMAEQAQEPMFDDEVFIRQTVEAHNDERGKMLRRKFPVDDTLPPMDRVGSIGATLDAYIKLLLNSDDPHHRAAAPIVGTVYDALLRGGMAFPPGTSPKKKSA